MHTKKYSSSTTMRFSLVHDESKNFILRFSDVFPQWLRISNQNFTGLFQLRIYAKLQNFVRLPLTLTKLRHTKCDHPVNFHFSQCVLHEFHCSTKNNELKHNFL